MSVSRPYCLEEPNSRFINCYSPVFRRYHRNSFVSWHPLLLSTLRGHTQLRLVTRLAGSAGVCAASDLMLVSSVGFDMMAHGGISGRT